MKFAHIYLTEDQAEYLTKKYAKVPPDKIQAAITTSRKDAEKLVYAYANGLIPDITPEQLPNVQNIDPHGKVRSKEAEEYAAKVRKAKAINPQYYQWILRVWKEHPDQEFDESWFHYLDSSTITPEKLLETPVEKVRAASEKWHRQFAKKNKGGQYTKSPQTPGSVQIDPKYWLVDVPPEDARIEGNRMGNCIGHHVKPSPTLKILSLRDANNQPHASMSIALDGKSKVGTIQEIKGKSNKPPIPAYSVPIVKWIAQNIDTLNYSNGDAPRVIRTAVAASPEIAKLLPTFIAHSSEPYHTLASYCGITNRYSQPDKSNEIAPQQAHDIFIDLIDKHPLTNNNLKPLITYIGPALTKESIAKLITYPTLKTPTLIAAIRNRKLTEQEAQAINIKGTSLGYNTLLKAAYHPEDFITDLETYNPNDLSNSEGFTDALETYDGPEHPAFAQYGKHPSAINRTPINSIIQAVHNGSIDIDTATQNIAQRIHDPLERLKYLTATHSKSIRTNPDDNITKAIYTLTPEEIPQAHTYIQQLQNQHQKTAHIQQLQNHQQRLQTIEHTNPQLAHWLNQADEDNPQDTQILQTIATNDKLPAAARSLAKLKLLNTDLQPTI